MFNSGAPGWDYTLRVNSSFDTGNRPGRNVPDTRAGRVGTDELKRQAPLCYDFALGMAGGALDIGGLQDMIPVCTST